MADTAAEKYDIRPLALQTWLSPAFPVGSFAYSHGLEWAVGAGRMRDRATAAAWLADLVAHGGSRNDAVLLSVSMPACAWRRLATHSARPTSWRWRLRGSRERLLETVTQGNAFLRAITLAWSNDAVSAVVPGAGGRYGLSDRIGCRLRRPCDRQQRCSWAFLAAAVGNMTSALVRLAVIGQTDAQRIIAGLMPRLCRTRRRGERCDPGRHRRRRVHVRYRRDGARDPGDEVVQVMTTSPQRAIARWHRRTGRRRQDSSRRGAVPKALARLQRRRDHQRHLHEGGCRDPRAVRRASARADHGRGDGRLPAHRDSRGLLAQSRSRRRDDREVSRRGDRIDRIRRRQSRGDVLAGAGRHRRSS